MNKTEFVNMINSLEEFYGVYKGVYLCSSDLYIDAFKIELTDYNDYRLGDLDMGDSHITVIILNDKKFGSINELKILTEEEEEVKIPLV